MIFERKRPSVFEYDNYRLFLKDLYRHFKDETDYFSYRYFSQRAGFRSPNFLKLVIDGQRNLTTKSIEQFSKAFRFNRVEAEHFSWLVHFGQATSMEERARFAQKLVRGKSLSRTHPLKLVELKYYANWYYIAIRELVGTQGFKEDLDWIRRQFSDELSEVQIQEALKDLLDLGFISRDDNGCLKQTHRNISTANDLTSSLIANYHRSMIEKSARSIADFAPEFREISGTCIACSPETLQVIKNRVREFRQDILALVESDRQASEVFQLNFQLFPITGVPKRSSK